MGPAKPLTADEIVKANAKKRAAGGQIGAPAKLGRLDAATMAALGRKSSASASGNLTGQGSGQFAAQGSGQLPGHFTVQGSGQMPMQGSGQFTTHSSGPMLGHGSGQDSGQFATQSSAHMPGQSTGPVPRQVSMGQGPALGRGPTQGMAGSSQMMQSGGPAPALTPGPGPVSPGLPNLSPMGPGGLLSPPSGLGNLFNDEVSPASDDIHCDPCICGFEQALLVLQTKKEKTISSWISKKKITMVEWPPYFHSSSRPMVPVSGSCNLVTRLMWSST